MSSISSSSVSAPEARAELERLLASEIFARSERLSAFLKFIVERTLAGEGETLKEHVIATELYGKGADFSTASDPIVRVDARRLRDRLREYYASPQPGTIRISVPKGSYTPEFTATAAAAAAGQAPVAASAATRAPRRWGIAGVGVITIAAVAAWFAIGRVLQQRREPVRVLTVTSLPGSEEDPSMSPDGNFVTFAWNDTNTFNHDIWIKAVDGDAMRRLTDTPDANEKYPAWSRDGQYIAFTRLAAGTSSLWVVSAIGGPEQHVADGSNFASWLPDGRSLVTMTLAQDGRSALVHHVLASGERRPLTAAPRGFVEAQPKVSPDGKSVAFSRSGAGRTALFVVPLNGGDATQLVEWSSGLIGGLTWSPDGRDIIYSTPELSGRRVVRLTLGSKQRPVRVDNIPIGSVNASASNPRPGGSYRLAFSSGQPDIGMRLVDLHPAEGPAIGTANPFCNATRMDVPGRFSRDASQFAFVSDRGGSQQVWVADRTLCRERSITKLQDATVDLGSWSPDGRSFAFAATINANTDLYVVPLAGGPPTQLTTGPAIEIEPEWSGDGRWIYYASNETGRSEIWKMAADGRTRVRLTSGGGFDPRESADGRFVYFAMAPRSYGLGPITSLQRVSAEGGTSAVAYPAIMPGAWGLAGDRLIFLVARPDSLTGTGPDVVASYDLALQRMAPLGPLPFRVAPFGANRFFSVSPDGRWAVAAHVDRWDRDILVLDNFR